jgi:hypothetical protein
MANLLFSAVISVASPSKGWSLPGYGDSKSASDSQGPPTTDPIVTEMATARQRLYQYLLPHEDLITNAYSAVLLGGKPKIALLCFGSLLSFLWYAWLCLRLPFIYSTDTMLTQ